MQLADELAVIAGHDLEFVPPSWCGAAMRVELWLKSGWQAPLIVEVARAVMQAAGRRQPRSVKYFEAPIARAHEELNSPVEVSSVQQPDQREFRLLRPVDAGGGFASLAARIRARGPASQG